MHSHSIARVENRYNELKHVPKKTFRVAPRVSMGVCLAGVEV